MSSKVESGKPIGKIVNNFNWNIGVLVPFEFAEDMDEGDTVDIRFTDIDVKTIKGTITRISPEEGGKVVLVINTNKYVDMIYSSSRVNVEIKLRRSSSSPTNYSSLATSEVGRDKNKN